MALPQYSQGAIQQRMGAGSPYPIPAGQPQGGTNQFQVPQQGPYNNVQPPNFYHIPAGPPQQRDPRYGDQYNPNYSGPIYNPYAPPTPYGANKVSPTGQVQGMAPVGPGGPVAARQSGPGNNGSGPNGGQNSGGGGQGGSNNGGGGNNNGGGGGGGNNQGGGNNGGNDKGGGGGGFLKGFYDITPKGKNESAADRKAESFLRSDPALQDTIAQLLASRQDYRGQFQDKTANIRDIWKQQEGYLKGEKTSALQGAEADFAGSGLGRSTGVSGELAGIRRDFGNQISQAEQAKTTGITDALAERQNFMRQLELAKLQSRSDALRRFAAEQMDVGGLLG